MHSMEWVKFKYFSPTSTIPSPFLPTKWNSNYMEHEKCLRVVTDAENYQ